MPQTMRPPRYPSSTPERNREIDSSSHKIRRVSSRSSKSKPCSSSSVSSRKIKRSEEADDDDDDKSFKTAQYVAVLKALLKDRENDYNNRLKNTPRENNGGINTRTHFKFDERPATPHQKMEATDSMNSSDDETEYEYHLELPGRNTELSSLTDTLYSDSSRQRYLNRTINTNISPQEIVDPIQTPIKTGTSSKNAAAEAAATILSAGGSFNDAVKTVTTIIKSDTHASSQSSKTLKAASPKSKSLRDIDDNMSIKSSSSRFGSLMGRSKKKKKHPEDKDDESMRSTSSFKDNNNNTEEAVRAWAVVAVSAAASVLGAGGTRTSAQAASVAVLTAGSRSKDHFDGPMEIAAAAEASAAVLATGSNQASATAAAVAILQASKSFQSKVAAKVDFKQLQARGNTEQRSRSRTPRHNVRSVRSPSRPPSMRSSSRQTPNRCSQSVTSRGLQPHDHNLNVGTPGSVSRRPMSPAIDHQMDERSLGKQRVEQNTHSGTDGNNVFKIDGGSTNLTYFENNKENNHVNSGSNSITPRKRANMKVSERNDDNDDRSIYSRERQLYQRYPPSQSPGPKKQKNKYPPPRSPFQSVPPQLGSTSKDLNGEEINSHAYGYREPSQQPIQQISHESCTDSLLSTDIKPNDGNLSNEKPVIYGEQENPVDDGVKKSGSDKSFTMRSLLSAGSADMMSYVKTNIFNCVTATPPTSP